MYRGRTRDRDHHRLRSSGANGVDNHEATIGLALPEGEDSPVTVLADSAYGTGSFRAELAARSHLDRVKPAPIRGAFPGGFTVDDFVVDHDVRTATCPAGLTRSISRAGYANFGAACTSCALRTRCTANATGKSLWVRPHDALQRTVRREARNPQWLSEYRQHRPMAERAIAWLVRGNRKQSLSERAAGKFRSELTLVDRSPGAMTGGRRDRHTGSGQRRYHAQRAPHFRRAGG
jgi:hypothetical protein